MKYRDEIFVFDYSNPSFTTIYIYFLVYMFWRLVMGQSDLTWQKFSHSSGFFGFCLFLLTDIKVKMSLEENFYYQNFKNLISEDKIKNLMFLKSRLNF